MTTQKLLNTSETKPSRVINMSYSSPILLMFIFSMCLLISYSESTDYLVGDSENSWKFPLPTRHALTRWASNYQFTVGDTITFQYNNRTESVHEVEEDDYDRCRIRGEHVDHYDGNTTVVLKKTGIQHFISGKKRHCRLGLKLAVVVMAAPILSSPPTPPPSAPPPRSTPIPHPRRRSLPSPSPSPSPSECPCPPPRSTPIPHPHRRSPPSPPPSPSPSPSPSESPSLAPSPSPSDSLASLAPSSSPSDQSPSPAPGPNSSGSKGGGAGHGFLEVLMAMMMFLVL